MLYAQYEHHPSDFCMNGLWSDCDIDYRYMLSMYVGHTLISSFIILLRNIKIMTSKEQKSLTFFLEKRLKQHKADIVQRRKRNMFCNLKYHKK